MEKSTAKKPNSIKSNMATTHSQIAEAERICRACRTIIATMRMVERLQRLRRRDLIQWGPGWGRPFTHQDRKNCSQKYRLPRMKARKAPAKCVGFWFLSWGKGGKLRIKLWQEQENDWKKRL